MNPMNRAARMLTAGLLMLAAAGLLQPLPAQATYTQPELDRMLAPIALYPDVLLTQILVAATRPLEVVEAARWSRARPGLQSDLAVLAAGHEPWHPSVKALLAFPQILERMDQNLEWTKALGDAYFVQEPVVMETIQALRRRARAAGQLYSDERLNVIEEGGTILLVPPVARIVHVPYYDPWIVYGPWWWPAHPPVSWAPWPGYVVLRRPGVVPGFWWGTGIVLSAHLWFGHIDWPQRRIYAHPRSHAQRPQPIAPHAHPAPPRSRPAPPPAPAIHPEASAPRRVQPQFAPPPQTLPQPRRPEPRIDRPSREPRPVDSSRVGPKSPAAAPVPAQRSEPASAPAAKPAPFAPATAPAPSQPPRMERPAPGPEAVPSAQPRRGFTAAPDPRPPRAGAKAAPGEERGGRERFSREGRQP